MTMTMTMMMMISQACDSRFDCDRGGEDEEKSLPRASARRRQTTHSYPPHTRAYYIIYVCVCTHSLGRRRWVHERHLLKSYLYIIIYVYIILYYTHTRERVIYTIIIYCHRTITALQTNPLCIYIYLLRYIRRTLYLYMRLCVHYTGAGPDAEENVV